MNEIATPSQTVGPFFHIGLERISRSDLTSGIANAQTIQIGGQVLDGDGKPVIDALIEIWQADGDGNYRSGFNGYGRVATNDRGAFSFKTIKPGRVPGIDGKFQAPHIAVNIFMRGLLKHLVTRIYFPDEPSNAEDAILQSVSATRRDTLIARATAGKRDTLTWNIMLQGEHETVFFDC
jgi:protocatechuate 3,4-dioxygenase, alpha subunit